MQNISFTGKSGGRLRIGSLPARVAKTRVATFARAKKRNARREKETDNNGSAMVYTERRTSHSPSSSARAPRPAKEKREREEVGREKPRIPGENAEALRETEEGRKHERDDDGEKTGERATGLKLECPLECRARYCR